MKDKTAKILKYAALYAVIPAIFSGSAAAVMIMDSITPVDVGKLICNVDNASAPANVLRLSEELSDVFDASGESDEIPGKTIEYTYSKSDVESGIEEAVERIADIDTKEALPVMKTALSVKELFSNQTSYYIDPEKYLNAPYPFKGFEITDEPVALIIHSHATESFFDSAGENGDIIGYYDENTPTRSEDITKNVVRVGEVFCETLTENGIPNIHCTELHDLGDYNNSYYNAQKSIEKYLEQYPSIRYIIDIHRDSIVRSNGTKIAPMTDIDGKETAQIMLVAGTDESGYKHPNWEQNFSVFFKYKSIMDESYPGLMRPVNIRSVRFNQHYSVGSMLLEIGSCGSTLSSCENSARIAAKEYAKMIKTYE